MTYSKKEDAELLQRYIETNDPALREAIILRYVPLVYFVIGRLGFTQNPDCDYEDLVSQGLLGLIEAVDRYNPRFGTVFSTYATLRIRGEILDHLRSLDWLPRAARKRSKLVQEAINKLWIKHRRSPTEAELAEHLNMDMPKLRQALIDADRMIVSLDSTLEIEGQSTISLHEVIADDTNLEPSEILIEENRKARLVNSIKNLPERDQIILSLYYYEGLTMREIGETLDVSESRICQLHARAIMSLRAQFDIEESNVPLHESQDKLPSQQWQQVEHNSNLVAEEWRSVRYDNDLK